MKYNSGFTMIELLVVISIIGILAALVLSGINPVTNLNRARDTRKITEVVSIAKAQEQYYASEGSYVNVGHKVACSGAIGDIMTQIPASGSDEEPYTCHMADDGASTDGFCISVKLKGMIGNCKGCECDEGEDACIIVPGETHFCIMQQQ